MILAVLTSSCKIPFEEYSEIPEISYSNHEVTAHEDGTYSVRLFIEYQDGDGDIGYTQEHIHPPFDTASLYYYNLHTRYYEKINGQFRQVRQVEQGQLSYGDTIRYNGRIPYLTPEGKHKAIKGVVEYLIIDRSKPKRSNTIKFDLWVYDRALHKSNVVKTPEIVLN